jgi:hypothetical protein
MLCVDGASLAHRQLIARLLTPLKRVKPRVPFYQLYAHRLPTLWTLYRGLLRFAPDDNVSPECYYLPINAQIDNGMA